MRVRHVTGELKELRQKYQIASSEKEKHEKLAIAVTSELNKQATEVWKVQNPRFVKTKHLCFSSFTSYVQSS
jgi:hypothetical protein